MLHWKIRLALIVVGLATVASVGGHFGRAAGFYW